MRKFPAFALFLLLVPLAGCDLLQNFTGGPTLGDPPPVYSPMPPYHVVGEVVVFYRGPIPLTFEPDPSIASADEAIGAEIRITNVLQGPEINEGDVIIVSWVTDAAPPDEPCFEWEVGTGITLNSLVEVVGTGNFCTSSIHAFLADS